MSAEGVQVEVHAAFDAVPAAAWDDLAARAPAATVFQGYAWNRAWWETRGEGDLVLLVAQRDGRTVGLAPLHLAPSDSPLSGRTLRFLGAGNADYLDVLAEDGDDAVVQALLDAAGRLPSRWARFEMPQLPPGAALRRHLEGGGDAASGRRIERGETTPCPGVRGRGDPSVYEALARKSSLKRHAASLGRVGSVTAEHLRDPAAILPHLDAFFRQHVERWSPTPFPSLFLDPAARAFYAALVERLAPQGEVVFTVLRVGDRAVAHHLGFLTRGRFVWYKPTFDLRLFRDSPGEVLLREILLLCARERVEELDFTRGDEAFKRRFADHVDENVDYVWRRRPLRDRVARLVKGLVSKGRGGILRVAQGVAQGAARGVAQLGARLGGPGPVVCVTGREGPPDARVAEADLGVWLDAVPVASTAGSALLRRAYEHAKARRTSLVLRAGDALRAGLWIASPAEGSAEPPLVLDAHVLPGGGDADLAALLCEAARRAHEGGGALAVCLAGPLSARTLRASGLSRA